MKRRHKKERAIGREMAEERQRKWWTPQRERRAALMRQTRAFSETVHSTKEALGRWSEMQVRRACARAALYAPGRNTVLLSRSFAFAATFGQASDSKCQTRQSDDREVSKSCLRTFKGNFERSRRKKGKKHQEVSKSLWGKRAQVA